MENYRLIGDKEEITSMIHKAPVSQIGEVWQAMPGSREVFEIGNISIAREALIIRSKDPSFKFSRNEPIYVKINYNNLIFKVMPKDYRSFHNLLSCAIPKSAKAIEYRSIPRTKLPKTFDLNVLLKANRGDSLIELKVALNDISEFGMGITTSRSNLDLFAERNVFRLIKVCGHYVPEEAGIIVKHISLGDHRKNLGIGLSSNKPFNEKVFDVLRDSIKKERYLIR